MAAKRAQMTLFDFFPTGWSNNDETISESSEMNKEQPPLSSSESDSERSTVQDDSQSEEAAPIQPDNGNAQAPALSTKKRKRHEKKPNDCGDA
ncbi:hypothetical protein E2C01_057588 [Portunus trituberculatus]|uniref:Uncharacterized protein n=1 Tax=Portunus trituberculatus TaxID=210409 RepID=A0A5B7GTX7_PORTR|nr:hypothetical protein [Portunus trituberculatus]